MAFNIFNHVPYVAYNHHKYNYLEVKHKRILIKNNFHESKHEN